MHSSSNAASKCTSLQPYQRAQQLSFPPTQSSGLLDSTIIDAKACGEYTNLARSSDQRANLQRSFENLLGVLVITLP